MPTPITLKTLAHRTAQSLGTLSFVCALLATHAGTSFAQDSSSEPPINYTVTLNGKPFTMTENTPTKTRGIFKNPSIKVEASKVRTFPYGGIEFDYPSHFAWEAELSKKGYRNWTLSGNDVKILYFVLATPFTPELFANNMAKQFAPNPSKIEDTRIQLGTRTYTGKKITLRVAEIEFTQLAIAIPSKLPGQWKLLVIQETPSKSGATETRDARRYLRRSFRLTDTSTPFPNTNPTGRKPI